MNYSLIIGCIAFVIAVFASFLTVDMVAVMFYAIAVVGIFNGMLYTPKVENDG